MGEHLSCLCETLASTSSTTEIKQDSKMSHEIKKKIETQVIDNIKHRLVYNINQMCGANVKMN